MSDSSITEYKDLLRYLYGLERKGSNLGLDRMTKALKDLGNPEKKLKYVHVAGTNGKGSVVAMLASMLKESGFSVGQYTSPHLSRFGERIVVNEKQIEPKEALKHFNKIKPHIEKNKLTFFEIVTIMAFLHFAEKKPEYVIMEVGLGGRLDATNVIKPKTTVITNVDLEHQEFLGETIREIATEKAGIIKPNVPIVTLATGDGLTTIKRIAAKNKAKLIIPKRKYPTNLHGDYQEWNAGLAVGAFKSLNLRASDEMLRRALGHVDWPGRLEKIDNVLLDCAHNPPAVDVMTKYVKKQGYEKVFVVFGALHDKDVADMLKYIQPLASMLIISKASYHKSLSPIEIGKNLKSFMIQENVGDALKFAKNIAGEKDLILVTGSCYLVGEALSILKHIKPELGGTNREQRRPQPRNKGRGKHQGKRLNQHKQKAQQTSGHKPPAQNKGPSQTRPPKGRFKKFNNRPSNGKTGPKTHQSK